MPLEGVAAGRTSLATVLIVGAAVIYGWTVATIAAALAMGCVELARRVGVSRAAYNASVYALAGVAAGAGAAFDDLGGSSLAQVAFATLLATLAFYLVEEESGGSRGSSIKCSARAGSSPGA